MELHTKSDFTALARKILNPLLPLYSAGGARLHLGDTGVTYPARTIEMEAFSRPLWALGPLWAGGNTSRTGDAACLIGLPWIGRINRMNWAEPCTKATRRTSCICGRLHGNI